MAETTIEISAPRDQVFDRILDAEHYPDWLVGADRIRHVEPGWPRIGSRFHHTIGFGLLKVRGSTSVRLADRPGRFTLDAGMGPFGAASVGFTLTAIGSRTRLEVEEVPTRGPARVVWKAARPLVSSLLWGRNVLSLERFRDLVETG